MARMRTIKPEFWADDQIVDLDLLAKLLYIGLWNFADDDGYLEASARRIKRLVFPDNDYDVAGALVSLEAAGRIARFESDQGELYRVLKFKEHQKPQHPTPSKFSNIRPISSHPHEHSGEVVRPHPVEESRGEERSGGETGRKGIRVPADFTITPEMRDWALTHAPHVDLDAKLPEFIDYWVGVPGAKGVKQDWVATWRNAMRREEGFIRKNRGPDTDWALRL